MKTPELPEGTCPRCQCKDKLPMLTSYVYQPEGDGRKLVSVTYTFECAKCGHDYALCIEPDE
jgi:hypothetical protein